MVVAKNDIGNTIESEIAGSNVETGGDVAVSALSDDGILSFVGGVAVGGVSGMLSLTINDVHNTVEASIENQGGTRSSVNAGGLLGSAASVSVAAAILRRSIPSQSSFGLAPGFGRRSGRRQLHRQHRRHG